MRARRPTMARDMPKQPAAWLQPTLTGSKRYKKNLKRMKRDGVGLLVLVLYVPARFSVWALLLTIVAE